MLLQYLFYLLDSGDGCFYIGEGVKNAKLKTSLHEPYQCCPVNLNLPKKSTKVSHITIDRPKPSSQGGKKLSIAGKTPPSRASNNELVIKEKTKALTRGTEEHKNSKSATSGKKGFFGRGN